MFEKESVEYLKKEGAKSAQIFSTMLEEAPLQITSKQIPYIFATVAQAFQDGAEYGYNKALEEATHNYNVIIADYDKRIAELEKENAELKGKLKTAYRKGMRHMAKALKYYDRTDGAWTDYFEHTVDKVLQREQLDFEEYGTLAEQLTKAKELLKKVLDLKKVVTKAEEYLLLEEAEQFLSEVEK